MGVDCQIYLAPGTQVQDVATVAGILLGLGKRKVIVKCDKPFQVVECPEAKAVSCKSDSLVACCDLKIGDITTMLYHFGPSDAPGYTLISPRCTAVRIAMGRELIKFFGGRLVYNDCGSKTFDCPDESAMQPDCMRAEDNDRYHAKQDAMWELCPLSQWQIADCEQYAAYHTELK